jgi:hypothetical protein
MSQRSKFVSFEMVLVDGQRFMGNMTVQYGPIEGDFDVTNIETIVRQKLNVGSDSENFVDIVTLMNWKSL